MARTNYRSVDEYLAAQPVDRLPALTRVREVIRKTLPQAEEVISYQIPAYKIGGKAVVYFAGWKKHFSLYPLGRVAVELAGELAPYPQSKGTVRFPLSEPVPVKLIAKIARLRAKETAERSA